MALETHLVVIFLVPECTVKIELLNNWPNPHFDSVMDGGKAPLPEMIDHQLPQHHILKRMLFHTGQFSLALRCVPTLTSVTALRGC